MNIDNPNGVEMPILPPPPNDPEPIEEEGS